MECLIATFLANCRKKFEVQGFFRGLTVVNLWELHNLKDLNQVN